MDHTCTAERVQKNMDHTCIAESVQQKKGKEQVYVISDSIL